MFYFSNDSDEGHDDEDDANISFLSASPLVENNPIKSCPWRESAWWIRKHTHICFSRNKQTNRLTINVTLKTYRETHSFANKQVKQKTNIQTNLLTKRQIKTNNQIKHTISVYAKEQRKGC